MAWPTKLFWVVVVVSVLGQELRSGDEVGFCQLGGRSRVLSRIAGRRCGALKKDELSRSEASESGSESRWCCLEAKRLESQFKNDLEGRRYVAQTLRLGGWMCRAFFVLDHELRGSRAPIRDERRLVAVDALCGFNATTALLNSSLNKATEEKDQMRPVVVGVHHNGLGNTLFQYAYSRLAAWALGTRYASALITKNEGAMDDKIPPHSFEAWESFGTIFAPPDLEWKKLASRLPETPDHRRGDAQCIPLSPRLDGQYSINGTFLYADRPADRRRKRPKQLLMHLLARLRTASISPQSSTRLQLHADQKTHIAERERSASHSYLREDDDLHIFTGRLRTDDDDDDHDPSSSRKRKRKSEDASIEPPRPHHRRRKRSFQGRRLLLSEEIFSDGKRATHTEAEDRLRCIKFIGYFQEYALYRGLIPLVRSWLPIRLDHKLTELPSPQDIVIHIRLCNAPYHVYKYYDMNNYFGPLLAKIKPLPGGAIRIITSCQPKELGVTEDLKQAPYNAIVTRPLLLKSKKDDAVPDKFSGLAADFIYLAHAKRLIICESTFSWWAAILSNATEIHAPATGMVPVAIDDPRFFFHDIEQRRYFGKAAHEDGTTIRFQIIHRQRYR